MTNQQKLEAVSKHVNKACEKCSKELQKRNKSGFCRKCGSRTSHGMSGTRPYKIWCGMKNRCYRKKNNNYSRYGALGVRMCGSWKDSFERFWEDMRSGYFDGATIDRIDSSGNYEPKNCRWATAKEQNRDKGNVLQYSYKGKTLNLAEWSEMLGIKRVTLRARIKEYGWSIERAFSTPSPPPTKARSNRLPLSNI